MYNCSVCLSKAHPKATKLMLRRVSIEELHIERDTRQMVERMHVQISQNLQCTDLLYLWGTPMTENP